MRDASVDLVRCQTGRSSGLYSEARAVEMCTLTYLAHCYARAGQEEAGDGKVRREKMVAETLFLHGQCEMKELLLCICVIGLVNK